MPAIFAGFAALLGKAASFTVYFSLVLEFFYSIYSMFFVSVASRFSSLVGFRQTYIAGIISIQALLTTSVVTCFNSGGYCSSSLDAISTNSLALMGISLIPVQVFQLIAFIAGCHMVADTLIQTKRVYRDMYQSDIDSLS